jgi:hypothetical protein
MAITKRVKLVDPKMQQFEEELQVEEQRMHTRVNHANAVSRTAVAQTERARVDAWKVSRSKELGLTVGGERADTTVIEPATNEVPATPSADKTGSATAVQVPDKVVEVPKKEVVAAPPEKNSTQSE